MALVGALSGEIGFFTGITVQMKQLNLVCIKKLDELPIAIADGRAGFPRGTVVVRVMPVKRALAGVVRLLDLGAIRIGNDTYARDNGSFGATTIKSHHVTVRGKTLRFRFRAKSGKERDLELTDPHLAKIVRQMQDLDGQDLFSFVDDGGDGPRVVRDVTSSHVNAYLRETMGKDFTAKNFRTWHASVMAFALLAGAKDDLTIKAVTQQVSEKLGNTPAITRKSYIHPAVFDLMDRQGEWREGLILPRSTKWLTREERGLIAFLEKAPPVADLLAA